MLNGSLSRKTWLAWIALGVGLLATIFASLQVKQDIEQEAVRQFAFTCDQVTLKIQERLGAYALILRGGEALFVASVTVERKEWRAYVETLQAGEKVPGVQGIGFAQVIPAAELASHIATIRAEGFPEYTIRPPGERAIYTSIVYLEPFRDRNLRAFGFDMYSDPVRRAAMEQARDTGEAALSGKVELVQKSGAEIQAGTLMYVPVYRNGTPVDTVGQRRVALIGWIYSAYRMNDLMTGILRDWTYHEGKTVDLNIYDGREATPATLLFNSKPATLPDLHSLFYQQRTIDFNGHQWLLVFDHTVKLSDISYAPAWVTLTGGFALSGLLFGLMLSVINTKANAARIAGKLTEEIRRDEELLKESDALKFAILNSLPAEIAVVKRDGTILAVNELWWRFAFENGIYPFKQHATSSAVGANYLALCPLDTGFIISPETWEASGGVEAVLDGSLPDFSMEYLRPTPTQQQWISMTVLPLGLGTSRAAVISHTDITERKQMEDQVRQLAFHDPLTKLPNRRLVTDRLIQTIAANKRSGWYGALMFLDLDNFKPINDTHGHAAGDLLLIEVADRLKCCVRKMDTVGRIGGDEFVVMLINLNGDRAEATSQAEIVAEKIRIRLSEPYLLTIKCEGKADTIVEHHCTASIGVALFSKHEASQDDILTWADKAMYQAKDAGRNLIRFYDSEA
jgi:diguanylate cyclase (GGDEF)-like protein